MSQNQGGGTSFKLTIFVGSLLAMFVAVVIMTFFMVLGADKIGELMLLVSIITSMIFVLVTAVMGLGSDY